MSRRPAPAPMPPVEHVQRLAPSKAPASRSAPPPPRKARPGELPVGVFLAGRRDRLARLLGFEIASPAGASSLPARRAQASQAAAERTRAPPTHPEPAQAAAEAAVFKERNAP